MAHAAVATEDAFARVFDTRVGETVEVAHRMNNIVHNCPLVMPMEILSRNSRGSLKESAREPVGSS